MLKYYALMFLIAGLALYYVFLKDPCYSQLRADFSKKHPGYEILATSASEGSPAAVSCHVSYRKPDGDQTYEDVWLYQDMGSGWSFSKIIESSKKVQMGEEREGLPSEDAKEASAGGEEGELLHRSDGENPYATVLYRSGSTVSRAAGSGIA